jgi:hypothetical protein
MSDMTISLTFSVNTADAVVTGGGHTRYYGVPFNSASSAKKSAGYG